MVEAIAQSAPVAVLRERSSRASCSLFGGVDRARFRRQAGPGDTLDLEVELGRLSARAGKGQGRRLGRRRARARSTCSSSSSTGDLTTTPSGRSRREPAPVPSAARRARRRPPPLPRGPGRPAPRRDCFQETVIAALRPTRRLRTPEPQGLAVHDRPPQGARPPPGHRLRRPCLVPCPTGRRDGADLDGDLWAPRAGAAAEAARRGGAPLPGRSPVRRHRRRARLLRGGRTPERAGRPRRARQEVTPMTRPEPLDRGCADPASGRRPGSRCRPSRGRGLVDVAYATTDSPIGPLLVAATAAGLVRVAFGGRTTRSSRTWPSGCRLGCSRRPPGSTSGAASSTSTSTSAPATASTCRSTGGSSAGSARRCSSGSRRRRLRRTVSYCELATMVGNPKASRAVGTAMATNPIPIVVPCHRVLRTGGQLGGYGGGLRQGLLLAPRSWTPSDPSVRRPPAVASRRWAEDQGAVVAAEAEAVRQRGPGVPRPGLAEDEVDRGELGVDLGGDRGRRDQAVLASTSTTATASMAPAAPSVWPVTPLIEGPGARGAEDLGDGLGLGGVVQRRRRAVGVDVDDVGRRRCRRRRAPSPCTTGAPRRRARGGDVVGVGGGRRRRGSRRGSWRPRLGRLHASRTSTRRRPRRSRSRRGGVERLGLARDDMRVMLVNPARLTGVMAASAAAGRDDVAAPLATSMAASPSAWCRRRRRC